MDNQDKIFDKFKDAAQNAETREFPGMEKVWSRVEDKLDKKEVKKSLSLWKKVAVAASFMLILSVGVQLLKSDKEVVNEIPKMVIQENEKAQQADLEYETFSSDSGLVTKEEAAAILENQSQIKKNVAMHDTIVHSKLKDPLSTPVITTPVMALNEEHFEEDNNIASKENSEETGYLARPVERESAKVAFAAKQSQTAKKMSAPLVVYNGNALAHNDDAKRDKMMQAEMSNFQPENLESLVVLEEPLYIIDGIYYSENDLFGNNPTSPYAPLNKQDIKTITILQDLEATSKYGEKGKKGVVIITTKTGKPAMNK